MKHALFVLYVLACTLVGASSASEPVDSTATVGAWNIKAKPDPIDSERAKQIALGIHLLDAEALALCEVCPRTILPEIVAELTRLGSSYQSAMPEQTSELQLALIYKPGVEVKGVAMLDSNLGDPDKRNTLTADVRIGKFDFHLVAVHLKSGPGQEEQSLRSQQTEILAKHVRRIVAGPEKDVLLVGDYNMTPTRDAELFKTLDPDGYLRFVSTEDLSRLGSHISFGRYGNLLDGFAISRAHTGREYIEASLRIFPMNRAMKYSLSDYEHRVSDHLPLVARFAVTQDDD